jgi:SpoIID/LytB domain protein
MASLIVRDWKPAHRVEPVVRIGVILEQDAQSSVEISPPNRRLLLQVGDDEVRPVDATTPLVAAPARKNVVLRSHETVLASGSRVRLSLDQPPDLARGAGITVHNIVAGRGFHWQKRLTQTLSGTIEIVAPPGGLVLVNELPLEEYLAGVITAEMGADCPADLLAAQCVVARSWLLAFTEPKHDGEPFDRCNDDCCQRYQGTAELSDAALAAVRTTRGLLLLDADGNPVDANYSKSCGGISEPPELVWGKPKPGLSVVVDAPAGSTCAQYLPVTEANLDEFLDGAWVAKTDVYCSPNVVPEDTFGKYLGRVDERGSYFRWTVSRSRAELEALLVEKLPEVSDLTELRDMRVVSRGPSGRAHAVVLDYVTKDAKSRQYRIESEYRIRAVLHRKFLYSSAFAIRQERDKAGHLESVTLRGAGWGHGAGMCQIGALGMALVGIPYERICLHYFPGARLSRVYE